MSSTLTSLQVNSSQVAHEDAEGRPDRSPQRYLHEADRGDVRGLCATRRWAMTSTGRIRPFGASKSGPPESTGKEAALLVSSGTQGNSRRAHGFVRERGDEVSAGAHTDLYNFENGGLAVLAGASSSAPRRREGLDPARGGGGRDPSADVHFGPHAGPGGREPHARSGGTPIPLGALQGTGRPRRAERPSSSTWTAEAVQCRGRHRRRSAEITRFAETATFCLSKASSCLAWSDALRNGSRDRTRHAGSARCWAAA